jgi:hypothetical protein
MRIYLLLYEQNSVAPLYNYIEVLGVVYLIMLSPDNMLIQASGIEVKFVSTT